PRAIASAASCVSMKAVTASMSATSISTPTFFGSSGLTNVRMLLTPSGPNTCSRFGELSQCSVSFTSWWPMIVGTPSLLVLRSRRRSSASPDRPYAAAALPSTQTAPTGPGPCAQTPADGAPWHRDRVLVDELPPAGIVVAFWPPQDWLGRPVPLGFPLPAEAPPPPTANRAATTTIAVRSVFISSPFLPT